MINKSDVFFADAIALYEILPRELGDRNHRAIDRLVGMVEPAFILWYDGARLGKKKRLQTRFLNASCRKNRTVKPFPGRMHRADGYVALAQRLRPYLNLLVTFLNNFIPIVSKNPRPGIRTLLDHPAPFRCK